jgi:deoxyribose-phosphate aldolase
LKTADQAGLDEKDNVKVVTGFIQEAIDEHFKLIMIRPDMVSLIKWFLMQVQTCK